ncbi:MAG: restriction endonuclease [bacterium]
MSEKMWMVRAGRDAYLISEFIEKECVAIGWLESVDLKSIDTKEKLEEIYKDAYPEEKKSKAAISIGQIYRFISEIKEGDYVLTYNPKERIYHIGEIISEYKYNDNLIPDYNHIRKVNWMGQVDRDRLSTLTRNTVGAIMTLFLLNDEAKNEFLKLLSGEISEFTSSKEEERTEIDELRKDVVERGFEFIKDKILKLDWEEMQDLIAGILEGMGYKARVSPKGADRGKDIIASPDGLGLEQPRIKVEVKHRKGTIGSNQLRSFIGGLSSNDRGLYVSTGGFTQEAKYEAERSSVPVSLIDIDDLTELLKENYENIDNDTKALVPLIKVYWPA